MESGETGMEPPSEDLKQGLFALNLATERDLASCRGRVRKLSHGLAAFDSVWLDALVNAGRITPYQAQFFEKKRWSELKITEGFVVIDQLHYDAVMPLFRARETSAQRDALLTRCYFNASDLAAAAHRLQQFVQKNNQPPAELHLPFRILPNPSQGWIDILSPPVTGVSLRQLLIRRGRFPEEVVRIFAKEICAQLIQLGPHHFHGDLRLSNIWLTPTGQVALLNAGVLHGLSPIPSIHLPLPYDCYDGIAPERFEGTPGMTLASEMYSLGCLLWQLLAGRPPHTVTDPLDKVAAHRQKPIPLISEVVPSTSPDLVGLIQQLTQRRPASRPRDFDTILKILGPSTRGGGLRLVQFLQSFESAAPRQFGEQRQKFPNAALKSSALLLITILGLGLFWNRDMFGLSNLSGLFATEEFREVVAPEGFERIQLQRPQLAVPPTQQVGSIPLPDPDSNGVIHLSEPGPYLAKSLSAVAMILRGTGTGPAVLLVQGDETHFQAEQIRLENVRLKFQQPTEFSADDSVQLQVTANIFSLQGCVIQTNSPATPLPLIRWNAKDVASPTAGRLSLTHCIIEADRTVLESFASISTVLFENVLQTGIGSLLKLQSGVRNGFLVPVVFNDCTLSPAAPAILIDQLHQLPQSGRLSIQGRNSIFPAAGGSPLIGMIGSGLRENWRDSIEISSQGLIVDLAATLVAQKLSSELPWSPLDAGNLRVDGLLSGTIHSLPAISASENFISIPQFEIKDLSVRGSTRPPGFDLQRFQKYRESLPSLESAATGETVP